ncbi:unnamed protein product [Heterosigma akashiwo]
MERTSSAEHQPRTAAEFFPLFESNGASGLLRTHSEQNPWNLAHARHSPDWMRWREAVAEDCDSLLQHNGYSQVEGVDYTDTFSPVASSASLRTVLAIAANEDMDIHCMDIKTAFLPGKLDEDIYMKQPEGYGVPGMAHKVLKLKRLLYGLKQAPKCWYQNLNGFLMRSFKYAAMSQ